MVALLAVSITAGCDKDKEATADMRIVGSWHAAIEEFDADVYALFSEDGSFDLYQRLGEGRYRSYAGTWQLKGKTLTGIYADATPWGDSYAVAYLDDNTMTLTALTSEEVVTYAREDIPATVIEESVTSRSEGHAELPIL